jgi:hypothetical protein
MWIILIGVGLFTIAGAALDWDWFMENRRVRVFTSFLGRNGGRVLYVGLGVVIIVLALISKS